MFSDVLACPHCGNNNDVHANPDPDATPSDGDISMCLGCGKFSIYCVHDDDATAHLIAPRNGVEYGHIAAVLTQEFS